MSNKDAFDMALREIMHAREKNNIGPDDLMPHIHEIVVEAQKVCDKILNEFVKDNKIEHDTLLAWCAYAGIGAVHLCLNDFDRLKSKGIAETLLEHRGASNMDEYVLDLIGIGWDSEEAKNFDSQIRDDACGIFIKYTISSNDDINVKASAAMCAIFIYGMIYQMERLGMK